MSWVSCVETFGCHDDASERRFSPGNRNRAPASLPAHHFALRESRYRAPSTRRASVAGGGIMIDRIIESYLQIRRSTGFGLKWVEPLLRGFARFASQRHEACIVAKTA